MSLLIKNITIIDPEGTYSGINDVFIENKLVKKIGRDLNVDSEQTFDGTSLFLSPAFIDLHCHLRDPGFTYKEDIISAGTAAYAGGFVALCAIANTKPVIDEPRIISELLERADALNGPKIFSFSAITNGLKGKKLVDFSAMKEAGAFAFSDDGIYLKDEGLLKEALLFSKESGVRVALHEEDTSYGHGTEESEIRAISRDLELLSEVGGHLHIMHISLKKSCQLIEEAKAQGLDVTCEITPHHLVFTKDEAINIGADAKCSPPMRSKDDVEYLIDALNRSAIDAVATDHAPHSPKEKNRVYEDAPNGVIGLQTAFSVLLNHVNSGLLSLDRAVDSLTLSPAKIFNFKGLGRIEIDGLANLTIFNKEANWIFTKSDIKSKSINSPFVGKEFNGGVKATIHEGIIKYLSEKF